MGKAYADMQNRHKGSSTNDTRSNKIIDVNVMPKDILSLAEERRQAINNRIRDELNEVCIARGIAHTDLARMAGLSYAVVGRILSKRRKESTDSPKFAHVVLIYEALGLSLPFTSVSTAPVKTYTQEELTELLAKVIAAPSYMPTNNDIRIAECQAITLIATGSIQAR